MVRLTGLDLGRALLITRREVRDQVRDWRVIFPILILTLFFQRIPIEIEESAKVDGASPLAIFRRITLPLSASSIVATGLFAFMLSYSEFL